MSVVRDPNNARCVEPSFTINLDRNSLVKQQFDDFFLLFTRRKIVKTYGFNTLSLQMSWTLFLWTIRIMPGGWSQASPPTRTGTPSSHNNLMIFFAFYVKKNCENIWFYYLISTNELYSVLVDNLNNARWMEPSFTVNLDRNSLVIQQFDDFFCFLRREK